MASELLLSMRDTILDDVMNHYDEETGASPVREEDHALSIH
jgi:hypothetical protein